VSASSVDRENKSWYYNLMTDSERLDWIDEIMILPKVMHFWFQTNASSVRQVIDSFAKAVGEDDEADKQC